MILVDSGPLIALHDRADADHARCRRAAARLQGPMITTWPAFTEAMYLLGARGGTVSQQALWGLWLTQALLVGDLDDSAIRRSRELMRKYADLPMDLADATLVALAESLGERRVFTLDSDFRIYRWKGRKGFEIVP